MFQKRGDRMDKIDKAIEVMRGEVRARRITGPARASTTRTPTELRDGLFWQAATVLLGGWRGKRRGDTDLHAPRGGSATSGGAEHLAPRTADRPGAVARMQFSRPNAAQRAVFQLGLAIELNATTTPGQQSAWATFERPPWVQLARTAIMNAKDELVGTVCPKEEG